MAGLGLFFTFLEYSKPLAAFQRDAERLAKGEIDMLQPSRFRGGYKKIAADLNDGIEKVAVKGARRARPPISSRCSADPRAADDERVLRAGPRRAGGGLALAALVPASAGGRARAVAPPHHWAGRAVDRLGRAGSLQRVPGAGRQRGGAPHGAFPRSRPRVARSLRRRRSARRPRPRLHRRPSARGRAGRRELVRRSAARRRDLRRRPRTGAASTRSSSP